jgi:four helix bundle protein
MRDFKELNVWRKAHVLVLDVYRTTKSFPLEERYGLTNQLRKSAASIPTNIAEGCGRDSNPDFARFLSIAAGSASETEYHLLLALDLEYLSSPDHVRLNGLVVEVKKMLDSFRRSLQNQVTDS